MRPGEQCIPQWEWGAFIPASPMITRASLVPKWVEHGRDKWDLPSRRSKTDRCCSMVGLDLIARTLLLIVWLDYVCILPLHPTSSVDGRYKWELPSRRSKLLGARAFQNSHNHTLAQSCEYLEKMNNTHEFCNATTTCLLYSLAYIYLLNLIQCDAKHELGLASNATITRYSLVPSGWAYKTRWS
jgi:hypothetical protein